MADQVDLAALEVERQLENLLQRRQKAQIEEFERLQRVVAVCMNCDEPIPNDARFCDKDCSDDYERRVSAHKAVWGR